MERKSGKNKLIDYGFMAAVLLLVVLVTGRLFVLQATHALQGSPLYHNDMKEPLYIPTAMTRMTLRPTQTVGKNFIYNHPNLEELHFMEGTQNIEAWAVENCPNLKYVYIPLQTKYDENAFMKVHPEFQVIRQDQTGIRDVLAD